MAQNSKKSAQNLDREYKKMVLDAYFMAQDCGRFTSQDICDNLRDTVSLEPDEVTLYMFGKGYVLSRMQDRMVWTDPNMPKQLE